MIEKLVTFSGDSFSPVGAKQKWVRSPPSSSTGPWVAASGRSGRTYEESVDGQGLQGWPTCPR